MAANPQIIEDALWHRPGFTESLMKKVRLKRTYSVENYVDEVREQDEYLARRYSRHRHKPKGCPERTAPKIFNESGELPEVITSRISAQQQSVAECLFHDHGLKSKAGRAASCKVFARRLDCTENSEHRFLDLFRCGLRYCPQGCGERSFSELFHKHMRLAQVVAAIANRANGRSMVVAKLDFTSKKLSVMPTSDQVRKFNEDIRRFFRLVEKEFGIARQAYGCLWCDEFGSGNTNLHAHSVYVGPFLKQKTLSRLWARVRGDGSFIVSIKVARSFELALAHCLKYPSKFFNAPGRRLAALEKAFHRVRRVHAVAAFYNPKIEREPGEDGPLDGGCPYCHAPLGQNISTKRGWDFAEACKSEGRIEIESARTDMRRARVLSLADCPFAQPENFGAGP